VSVLLVDGLDAIADPRTRAAVLTTLAEAGPRTLVVASGGDASLDDVLPTDRVVHQLDLPTAVTVG
jgi:hypothetical protein